MYKVESEDTRHNTARDYVSSVCVRAILRPSVKTVFITATEPFTEVIAVLTLIDETTITKRRILISKRVFRIKRIAVLSIRLTRVETFRIAAVDSLTRQPCTVFVYLVIRTSIGITVNRRCVIERIVNKPPALKS